MRLRVATLEDLSAIMALERVPGHDAFIGQGGAEEHTQRIASPDAAYLLWEGEKIEGFALLTRLSERHRLAHLKRIAVRTPGRGRGAALLEAVLDWAFRERGVHRVDLDVFADNVRARRAYSRAGFVEEGVLREAHLGADGRFRSMVLMAMLRPEWQGRAGRS